MPAVRERRHAKHLRDPCGLRCPDYVLRSALGAVRVCNLLPDFVANATSCRQFQSRVQALVCTRSHGSDDW
eukprot:11372012-Alexandrium_andersonii.AAC.1